MSTASVTLVSSISMTSPLKHLTQVRALGLFFEWAPTTKSEASFFCAQNCSDEASSNGLNWFGLLKLIASGFFSCACTRSWYTCKRQPALACYTRATERTKSDKAALTVLLAVDVRTNTAVLAPFSTGTGSRFLSARFERAFLGFEGAINGVDMLPWVLARCDEKSFPVTAKESEDAAETSQVVQETHGALCVFCFWLPVRSFSPLCCSRAWYGLADTGGGHDLTASHTKSSASLTSPSGATEKTCES